jgi:hypothetical protein
LLASLGDHGLFIAYEYFLCRCRDDTKDLALAATGAESSAAYF